MNANKKINNLKKLVVIISIAILVVAVILVMSIYNNKFGKGPNDGIVGGKKTAATTENINIDDDGDSTTTTVVTDETTTTSITVPVSDPTTAVTTKKQTTVSNPVNTTIKYSTTRTIPPTSGTYTTTTTGPKYTIITSGSSGFSGANSTLEWRIFNEINKRRSNKFKMATELRSKAETSARNAVNSLTLSLQNGCSSTNQAACKCDFGAVEFDGAAYCASEAKDILVAVDKLIYANSGILDEDYNYIGVGVVQDTNGHYSYVVIID